MNRKRRDNCSNPYQARAVNRQKHFLRKSFSFRLRPRERELRLSFQLGSSDLEAPWIWTTWGIRLNAYLDSIGTAGVVCLKTFNPRQPSSATIQRRSAIQKLKQYTHRLSIRIEGGCHFRACCQGLGGSSFFVDMSVGRMLPN